jgi:glutathione S-transferase
MQIAEHMHLIIGNKLYSSWSLRPWIAMTAAGIAFRETVIPLSQPDTKANLLQHSPTGKVPLLIDGDVRVWESLAILEYLAEKFPDKGLWPADRAARAHARAASNEMHAGFQALRQACPMNLGRTFKSKPTLGPDADDNVQRIEALWAEARSRFGKGGPFLYGAFCAADAMYAPVVTRLDTYQVQVQPETRAYMQAILTHPAFQAWRLAALAETWHLPHYEVGHEIAVSHLPARA